MSLNPIETAVEIHRALHDRGLEVRRDGEGRDAALFSELAKNLGVDESRFTRNLKTSGKSAEEYLRALMQVAQPFSMMFQEIWKYLGRHFAPGAKESLYIRFGFDSKDQTEIDWNQFRVMVESAEKVWSARPVLRWPLEKLFELKRFFDVERSQSEGYRPGDKVELCDIVGAERYDLMATRVRDVLQKAIDLVADARSLETDKKSEFAEGAPQPGEQQSISDTGATLADLLPGWRSIFEHWAEISVSEKQKAYEYWEKEILPKLKTEIEYDWHYVVKALKILDLPFWRHRWHTYEIWATVKALEALHEFCPNPIVSEGRVAFDSLNQAKVATLSTLPKMYAYVQGQTKLDVPIGKRRAIKPDLRFAFDDPVSNEGTVCIVEFKQRKELSVAHLDEVMAAYLQGVQKGGGVVVINYDSVPVTGKRPGCVLLGEVQPKKIGNVKAYQKAVRDVFSRAGVSPEGKMRCVLLDVSGSMGVEYERDAARRGLKRLLSLRGIKVYRFNDRLHAGGVSVGDIPLKTSGGTDLEVALDGLLSILNVSVIDKLLIVSDGGYDNPEKLLKECLDVKRCLPGEVEGEFDWLMS